MALIPSGDNEALYKLINGNLDQTNFGTRLRFNADYIKSGELIGTVIKTAESGKRITINDTSTTNELCIYDTSDVLRLKLSLDSLFFWNSAGVGAGYISATNVDSVPTITFYSDVAINTGQLLNFLGPTGEIGILYYDGATLTMEGGDLYINGDVGGDTKSFIMKHPLKEGYKLRYVCPEAPEVLVMCRGNGEIKLPDHFVAITVPDSVQTIKDPKNGNWLATGVRKGYEDFNPEPIDSNPQPQDGRKKVLKDVSHLKQNQDVVQEKESTKTSTQLKDK